MLIVSEDTPILVCEQNKLRIIPIRFAAREKIVDEFSEIPNEVLQEGNEWVHINESTADEFIPPIPLEVLSLNGKFTRVQKIIRYRNVQNPIYRIFCCRYGMIDFLSNQNLLLNDHTSIHCDNIHSAELIMKVQRDCVLKTIEPFLQENDSIYDFHLTESFAFSIGCIFRSGTFTSNCVSIYCKNEKLLREIKDGLPWKTNLKDSKFLEICRIGISSRNVFNLMYSLKHRIPNEILFSKDICYPKAFVNGYETMKKQEPLELEVLPENSTKTIFMQLWLLYWRFEEKGPYLITRGDLDCIGVSNSLKTPPTYFLSEYPHRRPVTMYNLETEDHYFHVGPGTIIV